MSHDNKEGLFSFLIGNISQFLLAGCGRADPIAESQPGVGSSGPKIS